MRDRAVRLVQLFLFVMFFTAAAAAESMERVAGSIEQCAVLVPAVSLDEIDNEKVANAATRLFDEFAGVRANVEQTYRFVMKGVMGQMSDADWSNFGPGVLESFIWRDVLFSQCLLVALSTELTDIEKLNEINQLIAKKSFPHPPKLYWLPDPNVT